MDNDDQFDDDNDDDLLYQSNATCSGASRKIDSRPSRGAWGARVARAPRSWGGGGSQTESGNPDDVFIQN